MSFPASAIDAGLPARASELLAAGSGVIIKPAKLAQRSGAVMVEALWEAGVPRDLLALVDVGERELGKELVSHPAVDRVILTGAYETAQLFRSFRNDLPLLAETSGKNAIIVTPSADLDLAASDVVMSARSSSPPPSSSSSRREPCSDRCSSMPGCSAWNALNTSATRLMHRVGVAPSRTRPRSRPASFSPSSRKCRRPLRSAASGSASSGVHTPRSHSSTSPAPYCFSGITPSNSP